MNDFDKIFSEKLHNHKTPPPANGWDQLNAALDKEQNTRKKFIYWRVAAVILFLLTSGLVWWGSKNNLTEVPAPLAVEPKIKSDVPQVIKEDLKHDTQVLALENDENHPPQPEELASETKNEATEKPTVSSSRNSDVGKQHHTKVEQTQPVLASTEISEEENDKIQPLAEIQHVEALVVEPFAPIAEEPLAMEITAIKVNSPVTIIYKPGSKTSTDDDKSLALAILNDLKNTSISFSDIRNAKSELLAKVFSKKENEVTP